MNEYLYIIHTKNYDVDGEDTVYKFGCTNNIARRKFDSCYTTAIPYPCKYVAYWQIYGISKEQAECAIKKELKSYRASSHATEVFRISKAKLINIVEDTLAQMSIKFHRFDKDIFNTPPVRTANDNEEEISSIKKRLISNIIEHNEDIIVYSILNKLYSPAILKTRVKCHKCGKLTKKPIDVTFKTSPGEIYYGSNCFRMVIKSIINVFPNTKELINKGYNVDAISKHIMYQDNLAQDGVSNHIYYKFINDALFGEYSRQYMINIINAFDAKFKYAHYTSLDRAELVGIIAYKECQNMAAFTNTYNAISSELDDLSGLSFDLYSIFEFGISSNLFEHIYKDKTIQLSADKKSISVIKAGLSKYDNSRISKLDPQTKHKILESRTFQNGQVFECPADIEGFINFISENKWGLITGGPGTGKTTAVNNIIVPYITNANYIVKFCAPTAAAANNIVCRFREDYENIRDLIPYDIMDTLHPYTMHKLFNKSHSYNPILYIIDEISMLSLQVLAKFISNINDVDKILFIGDSNQLQPVHGDGIFPLLNSLVVTNQHLKLSKLHRVDAKADLAKIYQIAGQYSNLKSAPTFGPEYVNPKNISYSFHIKKIHGTPLTSQCVKYILNTFNIKRVADMGKNYRDLLIVTYTNNTANNIIHEMRHILFNKCDKCPLLNKSLADKIQLNRCTMPQFMIGDYVMFKKNHKDSKYYNGQRGVIAAINGEYAGICLDTSHEHTNKCKLITAHMRSDIIKHSYCVTVHSAQGSESSNVCYIHYNAVDDRLIYTAVTRVRNNLRIIDIDTTAPPSEAHIKVLSYIQKYIDNMMSRRAEEDKFVADINKKIKRGYTITYMEAEILKKILAKCKCSNEDIVLVNNLIK